ncbi:MBL fold metallo-hydrolase [Flagellimonas flava]|uniref:MBL fold metallo-hydrolase n=1 Tax=Flagellimonas flava TaxID=570519 RepID=UPI003D64E013
MRALLALLFVFPAVLQAQMNDVTISVDTLTSNTYMLTGRGGNIGIYVGQDKVYMIDDQFAPLSDKIKKTISSLTDKPVSFLVNTHMHGDHTGGNANFNSDETTIVAQDNVRKRLQERGQKNVADKKLTQSDYEKSLPEITHADGMTFYEGDETIMLMHVHNAHTDGDTQVYFMNENVLHMGDTYFAGRYPYIDINSGGSIDGYIAASKNALMVIDDETQIIPGHGRPSNKKELQGFVAMLEDIKNIIQKEIDAGKGLEEVKNNSSLLAKYDETHGKAYINPERMREAVYRSLTEK